MKNDYTSRSKSKGTMFKKELPLVMVSARKEKYTPNYLLKNLLKYEWEKLGENLMQTSCADLFSVEKPIRVYWKKKT